MDSISEARFFAALVEDSLDAIIGTRLDGTITSWNPAAERLYGYPAHGVVGRSIELLEPGERQGEIKRLHARLGRGEPVADFETVRARKDGSRVENGQPFHVSEPGEDEVALLGVEGEERRLAGRYALAEERCEQLGEFLVGVVDEAFVDQVGISSRLFRRRVQGLRRSG